MYKYILIFAISICPTLGFANDREDKEMRCLASSRNYCMTEAKITEYNRCMSEFLFNCLENM